MSEIEGFSTALDGERAAVRVCVQAFIVGMRSLPFRVRPVELAGPIGTWPGHAYAPILGAWLLAHGWRDFSLEAGDDINERRHYWLCDRLTNIAIDLGGGRFGLRRRTYVDDTTWHDCHFYVLSADYADFRWWGKGLSDPFEPAWVALAPALARSMVTRMRVPLSNRP